MVSFGVLYTPLIIEQSYLVIGGIQVQFQAQEKRLETRLEMLSSVWPRVFLLIF